jgi:GET complex subunit GET2
MMLGFPSSGRGTPQPPPGANSNPFGGFPGMNGMGGPGADDPMLKLVQQMMGAMGAMPGAGGPSAIPGVPEMPPTSMPGEEAAVGDPYAYLWRIIHAIFAIGLGLYIALTANFTGTKLVRDMSALTKSTAGTELEESSVRFFYIFATAEVVLQTFRFYVEQGTVRPGGVLGMVMGFLPQPWKGYLALMMRYGGVWTTTSGDALVCIFVLGVCSWLRAA